MTGKELLGVFIFCSMATDVVQDVIHQRAVAEVQERIDCHDKPCNTTQEYCCGVNKCCKLSRTAGS